MTSAPYEYRKIPLYLVDVPKRRIRGERPERVETLAKDIAANGLLQPIVVVELDDGRFAVDDGVLRVLALRANKADEIDARVTRASWLEPAARTVRGIMANLNRDEYTALERCEALHALKQAYEALHPETRNGARGGRGGKKEKNEIFSFSIAAAEATGLSRRAIELAVAICEGLAIATKERLRGTAAAEKQSDLRALSVEDGMIQSAALDLLLAEPQEATSVVEAIALAKGEKPDDPSEKVYASFTDRWARFEIRQKRSFVASFKAEIITILQEQGDL
ncbi:ParB/RepB/Spo0J family partition protein [Shinella sp.]|jgi:ParB family chromosome partitioning protein|uniref:ParB/RepB/Spo0J family partition protein n=1 Tax=Shinella sp. TaxID=1870904 RepID=UPI003F70AC56